MIIDTLENQIAGAEEGREEKVTTVFKFVSTVDIDHVPGPPGFDPQAWIYWKGMRSRYRDSDTGVVYNIPWICGHGSD